MMNATNEKRSFHFSRRGFLAGGLATTMLGAPPHNASAEDGLYVIALEEHIATPELLELNGIKFPPKSPIGKLILESGTKRVADMDATGVDMQVLSAMTPEAAAEELERAVKQDGCPSCMTYGSIGGKFLDDPVFEPGLAKAEELNVPIYIHPATPTPQAPTRPAPRSKK